MFAFVGAFGLVVWGTWRRLYVSELACFQFWSFLFSVNSCLKAGFGTFWFFSQICRFTSWQKCLQFLPSRVHRGYSDISHIHYGSAYDVSAELLSQLSGHFMLRQMFHQHFNCFWSSLVWWDFWSAEWALRFRCECTFLCRQTKNFITVELNRNWSVDQCAALKREEKHFSWLCDHCICM